MISQKITNVSTQQERIAKIVRQTKGAVIKSLNHYLTEEWLITAYQLVNRKAASGIDNMSSEDFEMEMSTNVNILMESAKSGEYRAPPVKRVWIPKNAEEKRAIGAANTWRQRLF